LLKETINFGGHGMEGAIVCSSKNNESYNNNNK
jgi:hypothetical protein